jgi:LuxR family quorum-sensing system transcriptional regulator CciR
MFDRVYRFVSDVRTLKTERELADAIADVAQDLGFAYFALTHHVDVRRRSAAIRLHNYPQGWEDWFDDQGLGETDPVHRASHRTSVAFPWSKLNELIPLTAKDRLVLAAARKAGIGEGMTVPAHVPGEAHGSCSFAASAGIELDPDRLPLAQLAGAFAFEAARHIQRMREPPAPLPRLTDRQRECVIWAARGKSDWEISRILGVSHETVTDHLKHARERYGVGKRTLLAVHALFDGTIAFLDVIHR